MEKEVILEPLVDMWIQLAGAVPIFLYALGILVVGLIVSSVLSRIVRKMIQTLKIDDLVQRF